MKKSILTLLVSAILLSSSLSVSAEKVSSFKDVSQSDWFYSSVMSMTEKGYFAGKGEIVNGIGEFKPNDTMTKVEFLTVIARILFDEENINKQGNNHWWSGYYDILTDNNVIAENDFNLSDMDKPMTREEMAYVSVKAMAYLKEDFSTSNTDIIIKAIPDINTATAKYKSYIAKAYDKGILVGVDSIGTYNPKGSLQRAAATTVLYRIIEPKERIIFVSNIIEGTALTANGYPAISPQSGWPVPDELVGSDKPAPITIYEGELRQNRPAKEGDTFIKKDGTKVIVKKDEYGLVGGGQGLALDIGLYHNGISVYEDMRKDGISFAYDSLLGQVIWTSSYGKEIRADQYVKNLTTGEYHWGFEWQEVSEKIPRPDYEGTVNGEVSKDHLALWRWSSNTNRWVPNIEK